MKGARAWSSISRNRGLSASDDRSHRPASAGTAAAQNGTRQPHCANCASESPVDSASVTPLASTKPIAGPSCGMLDHKARRPAGACSTVSSTAPPHSPPSPSPCRNRSSRSSTGAATPIEAYEGTQPTAIVEALVSSSEAMSTGRRPRRSPRCPNSTEPSGLATKPTPNVANAASVPVAGEKEGKNSGPRTSAAAVP